MLHQNKRAYSWIVFSRKELNFMFYIFIILFASSTSNAQTSIENAFPNITFLRPVDIQHSGDNTNRLFIVSQVGKIEVIENNISALKSIEFLNITSKVEYGGEKGLLGLAFHPNFSSNGYFYVNYTIDSPLRTIISRFNISATDINKADLLSEEILLEIAQPFSNHNGGQIAFGPDGYLYISLGDGGSGGDPGNRSQNLSSLLGKILRIDVNNNDMQNNYSTPSDNPFINNPDAAPEIYAYGLRNVWRFSFDGEGRLWAADVGQNTWEEISLIEKGGNYGWRIMEGNHCYNPASNCDQSGLILPVWEYDHSQSGGYSITGGYVYEGQSVPGLLNKYVYGDYATGNIWAYDHIDKSNSYLLTHNGPVSTFGVDENRDLYFADYNSGKIFKFIDDNINSVTQTGNYNFNLAQNYPNPFNPTTTIAYTIPYSVKSENAKVKIVVFDILGKEVATLVNEQKAGGSYKVEFNAVNLPAGLYLYTISIGRNTKTNKMILLK